MNIQKISVEKLNPAAYNPRKDLKPGDKEYEKLKRSIEEFGYVEPVIWNQKTGNVVGGHQRLKVLLDLGQTEIDCVVVDLDPQREKALNLALNKIQGEWDENKLAELMAELDAGAFDVSLTGFDASEIDELLNRWSPALLRMELDRWLWKEQQHIQIKRLWEYLSSYCYLPRLKNVDVLLDTIKNGLCSDEYFAYAEGITDEGRYLSLKFNKSSGFYIDINGYLVRPEVAKAQIEKERIEKERDKTSAGIAYPEESTQIPNMVVQNPTADDSITTIVPSDVINPQAPQNKKPKRFYATVKLDTSRIGRDAGRIAEEIVQHLNLLPGASVEVTMEIQAEIANGVPDNVVRTVTENCRTLKFTNFSFEEE